MISSRSWAVNWVNYKAEIETENKLTDKHAKELDKEINVKNKKHAKSKKIQ
jgi:hypothetical protein